MSIRTGSSVAEQPAAVQITSLVGILLPVDLVSNSRSVLFFLGIALFIVFLPFPYASALGLEFSKAEVMVVLIS